MLVTSTAVMRGTSTHATPNPHGPAFCLWPASLWPRPLIAPPLPIPHEPHAVSQRSLVYQYVVVSYIIIGTAHVVCGAEFVKWYGVCLSVCPTMDPQQQTCSSTEAQADRHSGEYLRPDFQNFLR